MAVDAPSSHRCVVCRRPCAAAEGTLFRAFGRSLFVVHSRGCADVVRGTVSTFSRVGLVGAELVLRARAPKILDALKALTTTAKQLRGPP